MEKTFREAFRAKKWGYIIGIVAGLLVLFATSNVFAIVSQGFENYSLGYFLNDIENWTDISEHWQISTSNCSEGSYCIFADEAGALWKYEAPDAVFSDTFSFDIRFTASAGNTGAIFIVSPEDEPAQKALEYHFWWDDGNNYYNLYDKKDDEIVGHFPLNTYANIQIQFSCSGNNLIYYRTQVDSQGWTDFKEGLNNCPTGISSLDFEFFYSADLGANLDNFISVAVPPAPEDLRVFGVSPASGSTITDADDEFVIGWEAWDFEYVWQDIIFRFYQKDTSLVVGSKVFIPPTENGTTSYQFSDFNLSKNADYYFSARARSYPYQYSPFYSGELVSPAWYVSMEIEGWPEIFQMPGFSTWYSENVDRWATPTAIFAGISGFLEPIFSKIGEFGDRIDEILDNDVAFDYGYDFGLAIPLFQHYIAGIAPFFGNFPIVQIFLAILILFLAIFIIRLILKFIPGLG